MSRYRTASSHVATSRWKVPDNTFGYNIPYHTAPSMSTRDLYPSRVTAHRATPDLHNIPDDQLYAGQNSHPSASSMAAAYTAKAQQRQGLLPGSYRNTTSSSSYGSGGRMVTEPGQRHRTIGGYALQAPAQTRTLPINYGLRTNPPPGQPPAGALSSVGAPPIKYTHTYGIPPSPSPATTSTRAYSGTGVSSAYDSGSNYGGASYGTTSIDRGYDRHAAAAPPSTNHSSAYPVSTTLSSRTYTPSSSSANNQFASTPTLPVAPTTSTLCWNSDCTVGGTETYRHDASQLTPRSSRDVEKKVVIADCDDDGEGSVDMTSQLLSTEDNGCRSVERDESEGQDSHDMVTVGARFPGRFVSDDSLQRALEAEQIVARLATRRAEEAEAAHRVMLADRQHQAAEHNRLVLENQRSNRQCEKKDKLIADLRKRLQKKHAVVEDLYTQNGELQRQQRQYQDYQRTSNLSEPSNESSYPLPGVNIHGQLLSDGERQTNLVRLSDDNDAYDQDEVNDTTTPSPVLAVVAWVEDVNNGILQSGVANNTHAYIVQRMDDIPVREQLHIANRMTIPLLRQMLHQNEEELRRVYEYGYPE